MIKLKDDKTLILLEPTEGTKGNKEPVLMMTMQHALEHDLFDCIPKGLRHVADGTVYLRGSAIPLYHRVAWLMNDGKEPTIIAAPNPNFLVEFPE